MKQWLKEHVSLSIVGAILLVVLVAVFSPNTMRVMLTLPLILFLPGFALTIVLFKRADLGWPERLVLSVGLSVSMTALIALVLNWTPWGLTTASLRMAFLIVLAVEVALIAIFRRQSFAGTLSQPTKPGFTPRQWMVLSLAALVTLTAFYIARTPVPQDGFQGYTTLWLQPAEQPDMLRLGVISDEFQPTQYQIRFELNGGVQEGPTFELEPGETWESDVRLPVDRSTGKELRVLLYRLDRPNEVYRHAVWWLD